MFDLIGLVLCDFAFSYFVCLPGRLDVSFRAFDFSLVCFDFGCSVLLSLDLLPCWSLLEVVVCGVGC